MNKNIRQQLESVEKMFVATHASLDAMADGDRIQLKELAKIVGLAVAMEPKHVLAFVSHYVHNTDIAYITRGKKGGIIKGARAVKVDKPKTVKKVKVVATPVVVADDSTDSAS